MRLNYLLTIAFMLFLIGCKQKKSSQLNVLIDNTKTKQDSSIQYRENLSREDSKSTKVNQPIIFEYNFQKLLNKFDDKVIIKALCSIENFRVIVQSVNGRWYLNLDTRVDNLGKNEEQKLLLKMDSLIRSKGFEEKVLVIELIKSWCTTYEVFESVFFNDDVPYFFPEIISEIKITKRFVDNFFTTKEQYWGSLSESQVDELKFTIINYISELPEKERFYYYSKYYEFCSSKL